MLFLCLGWFCVLERLLLFLWFLELGFLASIFWIALGWLLLALLFGWCSLLMKKTAKTARPIRKVIARYHIFLVLFASRSAFCFANRFACSNLFLVPLLILLLVPLSVLGVRWQLKRMQARLPYKPALQD